MRQYRYRTAALVGPWRESRARAARDAADAGQLMVDGENPLNFRWMVSGEIEELQTDNARHATRG